MYKSVVDMSDVELVEYWKERRQRAFDTRKEPHTPDTDELQRGYGMDIFSAEYEGKRRGIEFPQEETFLV